MNALFTGWNKLSSGVEKLAQTAKQKVHELQIDDKFEVGASHMAIVMEIWREIYRGKNCLMMKLGGLIYDCQWS